MASWSRTLVSTAFAVCIGTAAAGSAYAGGWHGGGWHGSVGFYFGPYWGWYGYPYYWGYPYYGGYPYYAGYPYGGYPYGGYPYYAPYSAYAPAASVPYVEQHAPSTTAPVYWYYCTAPSGYYPYVKNCSKAWMKVLPQDVPAPNAPTSYAPSRNLG